MWISKKEYQELLEKINDLEKSIQHKTNLHISHSHCFWEYDEIPLKDAVLKIVHHLGLKFNIKPRSDRSVTLVKDENIFKFTIKDADE